MEITLLAVGGPAPGKPRPLAGTVTYSYSVHNGHAEWSFKRTREVGSNGTVTVSVLPGTYTVTGDNGSCHADKPVHVKGVDPRLLMLVVTRVAVYCQIK